MGKQPESEKVPEEWQEAMTLMEEILNLRHDIIASGDPHCEKSREMIREGTEKKNRLLELIGTGFEIPVDQKEKVLLELMDFACTIDTKWPVSVCQLILRHGHRALVEEFLLTRSAKEEWKITDYEEGGGIFVYRANIHVILAKQGTDICYTKP